MSDSSVNACSACSARYPNDVNGLNDCCYNTCASFIDGTYDAVISSTCGQNCKRCVQQNVGKESCSKKLEAPVIRNNAQHFKQCLKNANNDTKEALACCIKQCNSHDAEEQCIDAYNALIDVKEGFVLPIGANKCLYFLWFVLLTHYVLIFNKVNVSQYTQQQLFINVAVGTMVAYYIIKHIL